MVSGTLAADATVWNVEHEQSERMGGLMALQGKQGTARRRSSSPGDIGGVAKLKQTTSGDTLAAKERPVHLAWIDVPEPAISFAIEPKSKRDEDKIGEALHRLMEEDPTLAAAATRRPTSTCSSGTGPAARRDHRRQAQAALQASR